MLTVLFANLSIILFKRESSWALKSNDLKPILSDLTTLMGGKDLTFTTLAVVMIKCQFKLTNLTSGQYLNHNSLKFITDSWKKTINLKA